MLALIQIGWWHWTLFIAAILAFLALDLGVFHRHAHAVRFKEALSWTVVWFLMAMGFAWFLGRPSVRGREEALEFVTGYIIELSLSMDNVFVMALIFSFFRVPTRLQHRVLFWGIMGALILRGIMIGAGAALVTRFEWVLYLFGVFLVYSGIKILFSKEEGVHPEHNLIIRVARRFLPVATDFDGQRFLTQLNGRTAWTPLALVLAMVETTDLVFALDSIPAIFAVTQKPFIVFTSNVFAILGLRSLYFVLAGAIEYFRYLKYGLSLVLMFIGAKMLLPKSVPIPTTVSLVIVVGIIVAAMGVSVVVGWWERRTERSKS